MDSSVLGERISYARQIRGLTLEAVAQEVGVHKSTIQRYEKGGYTNPKLPVIESIARALFVNPSWLIGKSDRMDPDPAPEESKPATDAGDGQDAEMADLLERAKNDPHLRMLFSLAKDARPEDVKKTIQILQMFKGD